MKTSPESGNILMYILIAVALLAGLSYAISSNSRGNGQGVSKETASLSALSLMEYGQSLSQAVAQLMLRGCHENTLSFENNFDDRYDNFNAPPDQTCHIFAIQGGGVTYAQQLDMEVSGSYAVEGIGTDAPELMVQVTVTDQICRAINRHLDIDAETLPAGRLRDGAVFTGEYLLADDDSGVLSAPAFIGRLSGCRAEVQDNRDTLYKFHHVLHVR